MKKCDTCHQSKGDTTKPVPTTRAHAPCLASGCHIDQFLSTGPRTQKEDLETYKEAVAFCSLCHTSTDGKAPPRFKKAKANALYENKVQANFHVEMDHFAHTKRTECSTCHSVDKSSFKLVENRPNHIECASCHDDSEKKPMTDCASCHSFPGPSVYFTKTRKASDVRICSEDPSKNKSPCFKHERTEHRFIGEESSPLECSSCHFMFKKQKHRGHKYQSLADIKHAPMMDNAKDLAHKNCGAGGCHKRQVDDSLGKGQCGQCHSKKAISSSLFN